MFKVNNKQKRHQWTKNNVTDVVLVSLLLNFNIFTLFSSRPRQIARERTWGTWYHEFYQLPITAIDCMFSNTRNRQEIVRNQASIYFTTICTNDFKNHQYNMLFISYFTLSILRLLFISYFTLSILRFGIF